MTGKAIPLALAAAAQWKLRVDDEGEACYPALDAWLRLSEEHVEAYLRVALVWRFSRQILKGMKIELDELLRRYRRGETFADGCCPRADDVKR